MFFCFFTFTCCSSTAAEEEEEDGQEEEEEGVFVLLRKTTASSPLLHFTLETSPCSLLGSVPLHSSFQGFLFNSDLCSHPLLSLYGQQPRRVIISEDLEASPEGKAPQRGEPDTQAYLDLDSHSPHRVLKPHNLEAGCRRRGDLPCGLVSLVYWLSQLLSHTFTRSGLMS